MNHFSPQLPGSVSSSEGQEQLTPKLSSPVTTKTKCSDLLSFSNEEGSLDLGPSQNVCQSESLIQTDPLARKHREMTDVSLSSEGQVEDLTGVIQGPSVLISCKQDPFLSTLDLETSSKSENPSSNSTNLNLSTYLQHI